MFRAALLASLALLCCHASRALAIDFGYGMDVVPETSAYKGAWVAYGETTLPSGGDQDRIWISTYGVDLIPPNSQPNFSSGLNQFPSSPPQQVLTSDKSGTPRTTIDNKKSTSSMKSTPAANTSRFRQRAPRTR